MYFKNIRMRKLLVLFLGLCLLSCKNDQLRIPPEMAVTSLISPVYLLDDTAKISLKNYFLNPQKIKKVILSEGIRTNRKENLLTVYATNPRQALLNLSIIYDNYAYDIPILYTKGNISQNPIQIFTEEVKEDTIIIQGCCEDLTWSVYWENYKYPSTLLRKTGKSIGIPIPFEAAQSEKSKLRIWACQGFYLSNQIQVPLEYGQFVFQGVHQAREMPEMSGQLYDTAVMVFTSPYQNFTFLHQAVERQLYDYRKPENFPQNKKLKAYIAKLQKESYKNNDPVHHQLLQILVFGSTVPGNFLLPHTLKDTFSVSNPDLQQKITLLENFRKANIVLLYGDFTPLRVEEQIYAYLRSYFGKNIIAVFNKKQEEVSLKLDLPPLKRKEHFKSLFGGRFSYNNAKLILDVPADGVEIIYNE